MQEAICTKFYLGKALVAMSHARRFGQNVSLLTLVEEDAKLEAPIVLGDTIELLKVLVNLSNDVRLGAFL